MYSFDGDFRRKPQQSLGGASKKERRDELLQRAANERQKREESRQKNISATCIQSFIRGTMTRIRQREIQRKEFDRLQQLLIQGSTDERILEQLLRSIVFFYKSQEDEERLLWLCQHLLRHSSLVASLVCMHPDSWKIKIQKFLSTALSYLVNISKTSSPIALPMRIVEVFTARETYSDICSCQQITVLLTNIFSFLIRKDYFKQLYILINAKVPASLEKSPNSPTPLAGSLFDILVRPLILVSSVQETAFRNLTLHCLCKEFFCQPFTEQIECFVLPALTHGRTAFPFDSFLQALVQKKPNGRQTTLTVQPSAWLLYSVLHIASSHTGQKMLSYELAVQYVELLHHLTPTIHSVEEKNYENASDSEEEGGGIYNLQGSSISEELKQIVQEAVELLNDPWNVHILLNTVEKQGFGPSVRALCHICHDLIIHHRLAVHEYRLLYTLAFTPRFLRDLWQAVVQARTAPVFGSETPLLQVLARGMQMSREEREDFLPLLGLFCSLFSNLLITLHDSEFYGDSSGIVQSSTMPFRIFEVVPMSLALRDVCLGLIEFAYPDTKPSVREDYRNAVNSVSNVAVIGSSSSTNSIDQARNWSYLFKVVVSVVRQLYARDSRQPFCPQRHWISSKVTIPVDRPSELNFRRGRLRNYRPFFGVRIFSRDKLVEEGPPLSTTEIRNIAILRELPFVVQFTDRVMILQQLLAKDKAENQGELSNFLSGPQIQVLIRRNYIYEDAFDKLSPENEPNLKLKMRVQLINAVGLDEAGIDGGGIFREFLSELLKTAFDPNRGFFRLTHDNLLYPNPNVYLLVEDFAKHYYFIGRMLGKALFENMLVELPLAGFFLSKLLGRHSGNVEIHHLNSLDPIMYRNLLYLKHYDGDVAELGLDFTVANSELGETHVEDLKMNGSNIPVTDKNRIEYIHLVADYKLNKQIQAQCAAFKSGLADLINLEWLQMFDARELQVLISGASVPVNLQDLKEHTNYSGGYSADHPVIKLFWKIAESMDDRQRRQLLKFVTSCSRPPLLGFKELYPAFCIQNAGPGDRLPTSSTCMNLLKLPELHEEQTMRSKLLYAIESCSGFELS